MLIYFFSAERKSVSQASKKQDAKQKAIKKAIDAKVASKLGNIRKKVTKARTKPRMYTNTKTLKQAKNSKAPKFTHSKRPLVNPNNIFEELISTESAMKNVENGNTLVFYVNPSATKTQIKEAFHKIYNIKLIKVRTLRTPKGKKKGICKLPFQYDAFELASKVLFVLKKLLVDWVC